MIVKVGHGKNVGGKDRTYKFDNGIGLYRQKRHWYTAANFSDIYARDVVRESRYMVLDERANASRAAPRLGALKTATQLGSRSDVFSKPSLFFETGAAHGIKPLNCIALNGTLIATTMSSREKYSKGRRALEGERRIAVPLSKAPYSPNICSPYMVAHCSNLIFRDETKHAPKAESRRDPLASPSSDWFHFNKPPRVQGYVLAHFPSQLGIGILMERRARAPPF
ncbi:unnamed protein product [Pleuronectes platessa]|uniref:Uncharacterized protein n=1 Tax=Pleuronectes platessa TaxID=8262 RepID=A0A9N7Z0N0_PLEPL|nr:unnamed protein product [Pleuronectes platessa]